MKYIIKNKLVSLGGSSTVKDEEGNHLFYVKGRIFSPTRYKTITTLTKAPIYKVRNKFFHILLPKVFLMDSEGKKLLMIKKRSLFALREDFVIVPMEGSNMNITIKGDFIGRHYDILDNGIPVAHVRRNYNLVKDSFWMETDFEVEAPLYVALVIALDNYYDKVRDKMD